MTQDDVIVNKCTVNKSNTACSIRKKVGQPTASHFTDHACILTQ